MLWDCTIRSCDFDTKQTCVLHSPEKRSDRISHDTVVQPIVFFGFHGWISVTVDNTIKLIGAGAFAFHPTLEWVFIGARRGTFLAWDVSTERPMMIGHKWKAGSTSWNWMMMIRIAKLELDGDDD
ncbi:hypothetical protein ACH5RR_011416 [Cinchona calisaya]|uniref:Uncharacterized protein n=1 Tax=Cinchona calisaya TaxID=153742 RepID=A0ABD3A4T2_9GENT